MGGKEEDKKTERLIIEIEKNSCLYDKQSPLYKDNTKKDDIWKEVVLLAGYNGGLL